MLRWFLRFPIVLYRIGLGGLLGQRFLMVTHTGRKSGRERRTVIEVVHGDEKAGTYAVAAAWGARSDWFRNLRKRPEARVTVGRRSFPATAEFLDSRQSAGELFTYAERYPTAFRALTRTLTGSALPPTRESCDQLARTVPVVRFRPRPSET